MQESILSEMASEAIRAFVRDSVVVANERDCVRAALIVVGLTLPAPMVPGQLTPEERERLAERIPPLSQAIIEERGRT